MNSDTLKLSPTHDRHSFLKLKSQSLFDGFAALIVIPIVIAIPAALLFFYFFETAAAFRIVISINEINN